MASVDYDPIKAHEYYEQHKKLKGRHSTKGMSDTQKEQWAYARNQLKESYKQERDTITENKSVLNLAISERIKEQKKQHSDRTNAMIDNLRQSLKSMPKEQREQMKEKIKEAISGLRDKLKDAKASVSEAGKAAKQDLKDQVADLRSAAKEKHEKDLDEAYEKIKGGS